MVVYFKPTVHFKIFNQVELSSLKISFENNIILKLPVIQLLKWIAFCRYGTFQLVKNQIKFVPGIHNLRLYYPCDATIPIFDLASQFHVHKICDFHFFVTSIMKMNKLFNDFISKENMDKILKSYKIVNGNHCRIIKKIE